ncbi:MAG: phenylalanine 4-monooxygenase [Candidatus Marinimicrobia bacterium]|nr:phenylalanine 4-monooxygenase [Candidatus Neomarinimicrobiota bacterium]
MSQARNNLPKYLNKYITTQDYSKYNAIDQAVWRYIMFISVPFYKKYAHSVYLEGLEKTGIPINRIPKIDEMDEKLDRFDWGAVAVKGFIPPTAFMDMLANKVLAIGVDIRTAKHLMYTPAPDIIHETAGHAPIIADKDYANYLCSYGEVSKMAISSVEDDEAYEIIRKLSDLKEDPNASKDEVEKYENSLIELSKKDKIVSEAAELARMNWWTAEYGMIGSIKNPKIYGAGLLSSVIEGFESIDPKIKKIKYDLNCINYNYDITEPQPQLFVTDNFKNLKTQLEKYSSSMAYLTGGLEGLNKALNSKTVNTVILDSKISISGILKDYHTKSNHISYLQFTGPSQLCFNRKEITNQGTEFHQEGFGCPLGKIKSVNKSIFQCNLDDLKILGIAIGSTTSLDYESGIILTGKVENIQFINKIPLIITFSNCTIKNNKNIFFNPDWGNFDLISGDEVISVHGDAADYDKFYNSSNQSLNYVQSSTLTDDNKELNEYYDYIQKFKFSKNIDSNKLNKIYDNVINKYPKEWLLLFEILNTIGNDKNFSNLKDKIKYKLISFCNKKEDQSIIIKRGFEIIFQS